MDTCFCQKLTDIVGEDAVKYQEMMSLHTTFRIGGPADVLVTPPDEKSLMRAIALCQSEQVPFLIIGNGSNLLVSDAGFRGVILQIGPKMSKVTVEGNVIVAQAGASMAQIARTAMEHELAGMEFASGIPGTIGGGVVMNAGAYGGELSQIVTQVNVVNSEGEIMELDNETMEFGYRTSTIRNNPFTVTEVILRLEKGDRQQIRERMEELAARRREKQPLEYPSAGSTFKRPAGYYAGQLIMEAGLRGFQCGGAKVSDKHCGFVINTGNATAEDVRTLIREIQTRVKDQFNVNLETEVLFLGWEKNR